MCKFNNYFQQKKISKSYITYYLLLLRKFTLKFLIEPATKNWFYISPIIEIYESMLKYCVYGYKEIFYFIIKEYYCQSIFIYMANNSLNLKT